MSSLPLVLLAGGLGTRLHPYTQNLPKSLILIKGRPFLDYQLRLVKSKGVQEVLILIGHLGETIQDYIGTDKRYGLDIDYHYEGMPAKGTGGCIEAAYASLPDRFFLLYGDSYLLADFLEIQDHFLIQNKPALMTIYKNNQPRLRNNIHFDGERIRCYQKQPAQQWAHIDYGLSLFNKTVFKPFTGGDLDLGIYFQQLIQQQNLAHYEVTQAFYEIGCMEGIQQFRNFIDA